jgi:hypothetical protein
MDSCKRCCHRHAPLWHCAYVGDISWYDRIMVSLFGCRQHWKYIRTTMIGNNVNRKPLVSVGTKSLLVGVHQFLWHPLTVTVAWHHLYHSWPSFDEFVAIMVHDWGYLGSPNMDGPEGEDHPRRSAEWLWFHYLIYRFPKPYSYKRHQLHYLVKYHSRHLSRDYGVAPSKLCYADKYSMAYDPWFLYLPRAWLSGELTEYRKMSSVNQWNIPLTESHRTWYKKAQSNGIQIGLAMDANVVPYQN